MLGVSIVTPNLNQGRYLEECILSVLNQDYPNIEHIVMDGGSKDGSLAILRKYQKHLAHWQSCRDGGQSDAIDKGFRKCTGDILAWLNADDYYLPGAISKAVDAFVKNPEAVAVYGDYQLLFPDGRIKKKPKIGYNHKICLYSYLMIPQPSSFFTRTAYHAVGGIDPDLNYAMDYDLFLRLGKYGKIQHIKQFLSTFRLHSGSKSVSESEAFGPELRRIRERYGVNYSNPLKVRFLSKWYLGLAVIRFLLERGLLLYRKEPGKA
jgi:glycosyltransferase involved in cell wall biosynthesis